MARPDRYRSKAVPPLIRNDGANALFDMTPEEAQQFARLAAAIAVNTGNLSRGLREALAAHVAQRNGGDR